MNGYKIIEIIRSDNQYGPRYTVPSIDKRSRTGRAMWKLVMDTYGPGTVNAVLVVGPDGCRGIPEKRTAVVFDAFGWGEPKPKG